MIALLDMVGPAVVRASWQAADWRSRPGALAVLRGAPVTSVALPLGCRRARLLLRGDAGESLEPVQSGPLESAGESVTVDPARDARWRQGRRLRGESADSGPVYRTLNLRGFRS